MRGYPACSGWLRSPHNPVLLMWNVPPSPLWCPQMIKGPLDWTCLSSLREPVGSPTGVVKESRVEEKRRRRREKETRGEETRGEKMAEVRAVIAVIVGVGGIVKLMSNLLANSRKKRLVPRLEFNQEGGITYVETFGDYVGEQYFSFPSSSSSASVSFLTQILSPRARRLCRSYTLSFGWACCRCWQFCGMTE